LFKIGDKVKTGQKLSFSKNSDAYVISTVTGKISSIETLTGDYGKAFTSVSIDVDDNEEIDDQFKTLAAEPTLDIADNFLSGVPGKPSFKIFSDPDKAINTIIINGIDRDLLVATNQYVIKSDINAVKNGVRILKKITGIDDILIAVPENLMQDAIGGGAQVATVDSEYPATLPAMIMQSILGQILPAGQSCEDMGVCFLSAEAVASIGTAFEEGLIPSTKTVTFVNKDGVKSMVSAKIGTPVRDILNAFGVTLNEKDRLILGGPMTGATLYSEDFPVLADTDAIMIQNRDNIPFVSDYPCINCGECVRACPANVPVSMLVRFLEAGQYEEAADQYDLYSCIECGLCSFVCVSKMPVFHYIKLAKYELGRRQRMLNQKKLIVSHAPFWHDGSSITVRSYHTMLAALPAALFGIFTYGMPALGVVSLSVSFAIIWELLINKVTKRTISIGDGNAALIGLLFAMLLPATSPWWLIVTGTFVAVVIGKHIYGGIGGNPFNPVLIGIAILMVAWKDFFDFNEALVNYDLGFAMVYPLAAAKHLGTSGIEAFSTMDLLLGRQSGGIGATFGLGLILGGIYLIIRGFIRWEISVSFLAGVFVTALLFHLSDPRPCFSPFDRLYTYRSLFSGNRRFIIAGQFHPHAHLRCRDRHNDRIDTESGLLCRWCGVCDSAYESHQSNL